MAEENILPKEQGNNKVKKRTILRKTAIAVIILAVLIIIFAMTALVCNNISFTSDKAFAANVDAAIAKSLKWTETHKSEIVKRGNVGLLKMLKEINTLKPTPLFSDIINEFMTAPTRPTYWKRLVDPNWPINKYELNEAVKKEPLDNKWVLYTMAPNIVKLNPEEMYLFEPEMWHGRKLAHQLDSLTALKKSQGATEQLNSLIEHLCGRARKELVIDIFKINPGQVVFVLRADYPQKINKRWVERIVANQLPDGGWNNKWPNFVLGRRSVFNFSLPPGDQHDTLLSLTVLYLVKYQYPEYFGLK